jgi:hypothetical protein
MDNNLQESSAKKTNLFILAISSVHLAIAILSIILLFPIATNQDLNTHFALYIFFTFIKTLLIILNIIAWLYILKRKAIGWWSSTIYFSYTFLINLLSSFISLKLVIEQIKYLNASYLSSMSFSAYSDKLKLNLYEAVISLIIIVFLFQSNNIINFNIKKSKKYLFILLAIISISLILLIYIPAYFNGITIKW